MTTTLRPPAEIGLYVHIPWCIRKCPYCDFNSHELRDKIPEKDYTDRLLEDLETALTQTNATVRTVYFGGGTPSLFSPHSFERLLRHPSLNGVREATMEANPGTLEHKNLQGYREAGITRLSLGIQSLNDSSLQKLGRIHSSQNAREAIEEASSAGFDSVNLDMMFGLPDQTTDEALDDLRALLAFEPEHVSWYELTYEPNTVFGKFPPERASDDARADMRDEGLALIQSHGYSQYEVSAFAIRADEFACQHNVNYWRFGDYLGIGAGAHGKVTRADGSITRTRTSRQPANYMKESRAISVCIEQVDLPVEFMMNVLRLNAGVADELFETITGLPLSTISQPLTRCREEGLICEHKLALTVTGRPFLNAVVERFLY